MEALSNRKEEENLTKVPEEQPKSHAKETSSEWKIPAVIKHTSPEVWLQLTLLCLIFELRIIRVDSAGTGSWSICFVAVFRIVNLPHTPFPLHPHFMLWEHLRPPDYSPLSAVRLPTTKTQTQTGKNTTELMDLTWPLCLYPYHLSISSLIVLSLLWWSSGQWLCQFRRRLRKWVTLSCPARLRAGCPAPHSPHRWRDHYLHQKHEPDREMYDRGN